MTPKKGKITNAHSRSPYRDKDQRKVNKASGRQAVSDFVPYTIRSSMLIHDQNRDFQVIIKLPNIEFSIPSKNFSFIKLLTRPEIGEYLE